MDAREKLKPNFKINENVHLHEIFFPRCCHDHFQFFLHARAFLPTTTTTLDRRKRGSREGRDDYYRVQATLPLDFREIKTLRP